jgi:hypothetical protein
MLQLSKLHSTTLEDDDAMSAHASAPTPPATRTVLSHLLVPVLLATGMALAYLGGFHQPDPHGVRVDVVGSGPEVAVLAQTVQDQLGDRVAVRTVATVDDARQALKDRTVSGAYVPDPVRPTLMIASAASDTTAVTVERMLSPVALAQGLPLQVEDVAPAADTDPTSQGVFFYLVALSVGSYSAAIAIAAAGGRLAMRVRVLLAVGAGGVIALIAALIAGPLYGALPNSVGQIGLLSWVYTSAIVLIGIGLHTFLARWTTATLVGLSVMLNFTSAGGVFAPALQPGFFAALHSFWIGSGLLEAGRNLMYFPGLGIGRQVLTLMLWLVAGLALTGVAALAELRRAAPTAPPADESTEPTSLATATVPQAEDRVEEELEESVPVG